MKNTLTVAIMACVAFSVLLPVRATGEIFDATRQFEAGSKPLFPAAADFDSDGWPDLVVADTLSDSLIVLFNDGLGGLEGRTGVNVGHNPQRIVTGDFNGDGWPDLACVTAPPLRVLIWYNDNGHAFLPMDSLVTDLYWGFVFAADYDGDGTSELSLSPYDNSGMMFIYQCDKTELFSQIDTFQIGSYFYAPGDIDLNGAADLVVDLPVVAVPVGQHPIVQIVGVARQQHTSLALA